MKNYVDKWFSNSNLLRKSKEGRTEVISRLLFTFVAHKLQKHLNFSNNFHPCFTIMMSRVWKIFIQSHVESMQGVKISM